MSEWIWLCALMTHCSSVGGVQFLQLVTHKFQCVSSTTAGAAAMTSLLPMLGWLLMLCGQFRSWDCWVTREVKIFLVWSYTLPLFLILQISKSSDFVAPWLFLCSLSLVPFCYCSQHWAPTLWSQIHNPSSQVAEVGDDCQSSPCKAQKFLILHDFTVSCSWFVMPVETSPPSWFSVSPFGDVVPQGSERSPSRWRSTVVSSGEALPPCQLWICQAWEGACLSYLWAAK